jgi:hypothetical protein
MDAVTTDLWYDTIMKKQASASKRPSNKRAAKKAPSKVVRSREASPIIGRRRFEKISAVEGIVLNERMNARIAEFERRGASAEERRGTIIRAYRKG